MNVTQQHPLDIIELAPEVLPLNDAITEEEHNAKLTEEQRQVSTHYYDGQVATRCSLRTGVLQHDVHGTVALQYLSWFVCKHDSFLGPTD